MNSPREAFSEDLLDSPRVPCLASTPRWKIRHEASSLVHLSGTFLPAHFPPGITAGVGLLHAAVTWVPTWDA